MAQFLEIHELTRIESERFKAENELEIFESKYTKDGDLNIPTEYLEDHYKLCDKIDRLQEEYDKVFSKFYSKINKKNNPKLNIEIVRAAIITGQGTDLIMLYFNGPSTYPDWLPDELPHFRMDVAKGHGEEYLRDVLQIKDFEVINT